MNDRSNIDAAWNDLLGGDEPEAATDGSGVRAPSIAPPARSVARAPSFAPPPGSNAARPKVRVPARAVAPTAPSAAPPSVTPPSVTPSPPRRADAVGLVPPPPEYTPPEYSSEVRLEVGSEIGVGLDDESHPVAVADGASPAVVAEPSPVPIAGDHEDDDYDVEVDLDASEHALAMLSLAEHASAVKPTAVLEDAGVAVPPSGAHLRPVESMPWSSPARIASPAVEVLHSRTPTTGSNPIVPVQPRRSARFSTVPSPARSRVPLWIGLGVAAVAVAVAVGWWQGTGDAPADAPARAAKLHAQGDAAATPPDDGATPTSAAAPTDAAPPSVAVPAAEDAMAPVDPPAPDDAPPPSIDLDAPPPSDDPPSDAPPSDAPPSDAVGSSPAYEAAAADYRATGSATALVAMITSACAIDEGPRARDAFRKLKGTSLRKHALIECRTLGVDLMTSNDGYNGPELLRRARHAMEAGDPARALELARASNRLERNGTAMLLAGLAACALHDREEAKRLLPHVAKKSRRELLDGCAASGVAL